MFIYVILFLIMITYAYDNVNDEEPILHKIPTSIHALAPTHGQLTKKKTNCVYCKCTCVKIAAKQRIITFTRSSQTRNMG